MSNANNDLYRLLGISSSATGEEIKAAFRAKIREYHPDKEKGDEDLAKRLINANRILTNDILRKDYDVSRDDRPAEAKDQGGQRGEYPELGFGPKISDTYVRMISAFRKEYEFLEIQDNYFQKFSKLVNKIAATHDIFKEDFETSPAPDTKGPFHCSLCKLNFRDEPHHNSEIIETYIYYLTEGGAWDEPGVKDKEKQGLTSVYYKFLEMLGEDKWGCEPTRYPKTIDSFWTSTQEWEKVSKWSEESFKRFITKYRYPITGSIVLEVTEGIDINFLERIMKILHHFELESEQSMGEYLGVKLDLAQEVEKKMTISDFGESTGGINTNIWGTLKTTALELEDFESSLLFCKLEQLFLSQNGAVEDCWYKTGLEIHALGGKSFAHICFVLGSCDFEYVAAHFFKEGDHRSAIEYYLYKGQWGLIREKAIQIKQFLELAKADKCQDAVEDRPAHYWYYAEIIKKLEMELDAAPDLVEPVQELMGLIQEVFPSKEKQKAELLVWIFRTFPEIILDDELGEPIHVLLRDYFASTSSIKALGAYHFCIWTRGNEQGEDEETLRKFHTKFELNWGVTLDMALRNSDFDLLTNTLEQMRADHLELAELLFQTRTLGMDIDEFPDANVRATLYLLRGTLRKLRSDVHGALADYQQAFSQINYVGVSKCLAKLVQDPTFHIHIIELIREEFHRLMQKANDSEFLYPQLDEQKLEGTAAIFGRPTEPKKKPNDLPPTPGNTYLTVIRKAEIAIEQRLGAEEPLNAALAYMDLCMALGDPGGLNGAQIMACNYFLRAMKTATSTGQPDLVYAYRKTIHVIAGGLYISGQRITTPFLKSYVNVILFNILTAANEIFVISLRNEEKRVRGDPNASGAVSLLIPKKFVPIMGPGEKAILRGLLCDWLGLGKIAPLLLVSSHLAFDTVFLDMKGLAFLKAFLQEKLGRTEHPMGLPRSLFAYYQFEGVWHKWLGHSDLILSKMEAMDALLDEKGWDGEDVEAAFGWSSFLYNEDGWRRPGLPLVFEDEAESFSSIDGVQMNLETGEVNFLLSKDGPGLFTLDDIAEVFEHGIDFASLTLEQPEPPAIKLHPFQHLRYSPASLAGTNYLRTIAAADVLLKQLTTGVEVNINYPFEMRSTTSGTGLLVGLPSNIRDILRPLHTRKDSHAAFSENAHRFWIEVENVDVEYEGVEGKQPVTIFKVGGAKASVREHPLKTDINGRKVDDDKVNVDSAEAKFAAEMSANYETIGQYFPELLRLEQLIKISFIYRFIRRKINSLDETIKSDDLFSKQVDGMLGRLRDQIKTYPIYTHQNIEQEMTQARAQFNATHDLTKYKLDEAGQRAHITSQLQQAEISIKSQIQQIFVENSQVSTAEVQLSLIDNWLRSNPNNLKDILVRAEKNKVVRLKEAILTSIGVPINLEDTPFDPSKIWADENGMCSWLPAAFCDPATDDKNKLTIYGGVKMMPPAKEVAVEIGLSLIPLGWVGKAARLIGGRLAPKVLRSMKGRVGKGSGPRGKGPGGKGPGGKGPGGKGPGGQGPGGQGPRGQGPGGQGLGGQGPGGQGPGGQGTAGNSGAAGNNGNGSGWKPKYTKDGKPDFNVGRKLGPSGLPMRHFVRLKSKKAVKDYGKGTKVIDKAHGEGQKAHGHNTRKGTDGKGNPNRREDGVHLNYGKKAKDWKRFHKDSGNDPGAPKN